VTVLKEDGYVSKSFDYYKMSDTTPEIENIVYIDAKDVEIGAA